jgi:hypothetical protein
MKSLLSILLLAGTIPACAQTGERIPTWTQEPDGFKGVKFGSTEAEAKTATSIPLRCLSVKSERACMMVVPVGSFNMEVLLQFVADKFTKAVGTFPSDSFSDVRDIFFEKYGKPHNVTEETLQNGMGAQFHQEHYGWRGKLCLITLSKYGSSPDEGLFSLSPIDTVDAEEKAREEAKKKALK